MTDLEQRILQTYRRLTPEELEIEKGHATDNLQRYTERLQMLETMDDRLELVRMMRANPSEFVHPTVKENYLNEFQGKISAANRDLRLIALVENERLAVEPAPEPSLEPTPAGECLQQLKDIAGLNDELYGIKDTYADQKLRALYQHASKYLRDNNMDTSAIGLTVDRQRDSLELFCYVVGLMVGNQEKPFIAVQLAVLVLVILFPPLVTWLPSLMAPGAS